MSTNYFSNYKQELTNLLKSVSDDANEAKTNSEVPELIKINLESFANSLVGIINIASNNEAIENKYNTPNAGIKSKESENDSSENS